MAKAKDNSWEVQIFNCGQSATGVAVRFGKNTIEVIVADPCSEEEKLDQFVRHPGDRKSKVNKCGLPATILVNGKERTSFSNYAA